jgi:hypothetical protein
LECDNTANRPVMDGVVRAQWREAVVDEEVDEVKVERIP